MTACSVRNSVTHGRGEGLKEYVGVLVVGAASQYYNFNRAANVVDRFAGNAQSSFNSGRLRHQKQAAIDLRDGTVHEKRGFISSVQSRDIVRSNSVFYVNKKKFFFIIFSKVLVFTKSKLKCP